MANRILLPEYRCSQTEHLQAYDAGTSLRRSKVTVVEVGRVRDRVSELLKIENVTDVQDLC